MVVNKCIAKELPTLQREYNGVFRTPLKSKDA